MKTQIGTWFGKEIEDLEKEELLKVIKHLSDELRGMKNERDSLGDGYYDLLVKKELHV
jgi:hypothetical protein